jgi:predicted lactoylglutathione lyase
MDQRISLVTLAVSDLDATRRFYLEGLGWQAFMDVPDDVLMIQVGEHLLLSLWVESHFEAEVGAIRRGKGVAPFTIAHNLTSDAEVDAVLETARAAGADPVQPAVKREWGGYSGYFGDPDGYRWEIAHAPGQIKELVVPR